jgi:serine beta-lactamase-like protein LACTB, mitochondrial
MASALLSNASWVSAIDDSARTLAAPFQGPAPRAAQRACPIDGQHFEVQWGEQALHGTVQVQAGHASGCELRLGLHAHPKGFDNQGPPRAPAPLRLISLQQGSAIARAALATPIGLSLLDADADGRLRGSVARREWVMTFSIGRGCGQTCAD